MALCGYIDSVLLTRYLTLASIVVLWSALSVSDAIETPSLTLSPTNLIVRNGEMLELSCEVDQFITDGIRFRWEHYQNSAGQTQYYTTELSNANVNITFGTTRTVLQFKHLSSTDSGVIKCVYPYPDPDGIGSKIVSLETSLCVSEEPRLPTCFTTEPGNDMFSLLCTTDGMSLCPLDISLQIRLAGNGTIIDGTRTNSPIERITNTIPKKHLADGGYICTLSSNLFPSSKTTCSFVLPETTTLAIFSKLVSDANNKTGTTEETDEHATVGVYVTTTKNKPVTFSQIEVIIAASAAAGGVLIIAILICIIKACCKIRNRRNRQTKTEIDMRKKTFKPEDQYTDEEHQNSDNLLLGRNTKNGQGRKESIPLCAKHDKSSVKNKAPVYETVHENDPTYHSITDETSNSALYATADELDDQRQEQNTSVPQILNEETSPSWDREKLPTPISSPHVYAYASFDLSGGAPTPEDGTMISDC